MLHLQQLMSQPELLSVLVVPPQQLPCWLNQLPVVFGVYSCDSARCNTCEPNTGFSSKRCLHTPRHLPADLTSSQHRSHFFLLHRHCRSGTKLMTVLSMRFKNHLPGKRTTAGNASFAWQVFLFDGLSLVTLHGPCTGSICDGSSTLQGRQLQPR